MDNEEGSSFTLIQSINRFLPIDQMIWVVGRIVDHFNGKMGLIYPF